MHLSHSKVPMFIIKLLDLTVTVVVTCVIQRADLTSSPHKLKYVVFLNSCFPILCRPLVVAKRQKASIVLDFFVCFMLALVQSSCVCNNVHARYDRNIVYRSCTNLDTVSTHHSLRIFLYEAWK